MGTVVHPEREAALSVAPSWLPPLPSIITSAPALPAPAYPLHGGRAPVGLSTKPLALGWSCASQSRSLTHSTGHHRRAADWVFSWSRI